MSIHVSQLTKHFLVPIKEPGFWGSVRGLFYRQKQRVEAVRGISFDIQPGELVAFLGPNGAGKTTTLKMLSGLLHPTSGEATVMGHVPWKREREFQRRFTMVMGQRTQLWWDLPAWESFKLNKEIFELSDSAFKETSEELIDLLELSDVLQIPVKKLSLGQRMKAELACSLLHRPHVLLLDEPTIGLDVVMQARVRSFIRTYNQRYQATILLTSHNMEDISELCERIILINHGQLFFDGSLKDFQSKTHHVHLADTLREVFSASSSVVPPT